MNGCQSCSFVLHKRSLEHLLLLLSILIITKVFIFCSFPGSVDVRSPLHLNDNHYLRIITICFLAWRTVDSKWRRGTDSQVLLKSICFGAQSIEHGNVLSEKINFSAPGGRKVAIFGMEDLDPLYFDVSNVSAPPDPPICLKTPKCAIFCTFRESHLEYTPKVGVRYMKV